MKHVYLMTRADDCGSNHTANIAILEAVEKGIAKNVSIMATGEAVEEAAELFKHKTDVCFGLHVTLNAEWDDIRWGPVSPVEEVPSLVDEQGHLLQTVDALNRRKPVVEEIIREMDAQLNRLIELGFKITYADQHMFFGSAIDNFDTLFDDWCHSHGLINGDQFSQFILSEIYSYFNPLTYKADPIEVIIKIFKKLKPGYYLTIAHPAFDNEEMRTLYHTGFPSNQVALGRDRERLLYTDPRIINCIKDESIVLLRFDEK